MATFSPFGQVGNRPSNQPDADWSWCDYSLSIDQARAEARAHHDADCGDADYELLDWALRLEDGSVLLV